MNNLTLEWHLANVIELPPARFGGALVINPKDQTALLFGGVNSSKGYLDDLWVSDGRQWKQQQTPKNPPSRLGMSLIWGDDQQTALLFGGVSGNQLLGDTWSFDGAVWATQTPKNSPSPRLNACMAYDNTRKQTILFGGKVNVGRKSLENSNETWIWDEKEWQQMLPANSPPARSGACLSYDNTNQALLLFGGEAGGGFLDDTWIWDGTNWIEQKPSNHPAGRADFGMAYHPDIQQIVLFGGQTYSSLSVDTWVWDGKDWTELLTKQSPPIQVSYGNRLVYMPSLKAIVLYNAFREKTIISDDKASIEEHSEFWALGFA